MSVVYFIQSGANGPIKIGTARDLPKRIALLQCGNPEPLVVLATCPGGRAVEGAYHRHLREHRLRGEWFAPSDKVKSAVEGARNGEAPPLAPRAACAGSIHAKIIRAAGIDPVAEACGVSTHTVRSWVQRERVPAEHWATLVDRKLATLAELANGMRPRKPAESAAA